MKFTTNFISNHFLFYAENICFFFNSYKCPLYIEIISRMRKWSACILLISLLTFATKIKLGYLRYSVCRICIEHLRQWKKEIRTSMKFGVPTIWQEHSSKRSLKSVVLQNGKKHDSILIVHCTCMKEEYEIC